MTGTDIRAILFDVDDTLFDRLAAQTLILKTIVDTYPYLFGNIAWDNLVTAFFESDRLVELDFEAGAPSDNLRKDRSRLFLHQLGLPADYADAITETYVSDYPGVNAPVAGAPELIQALADTYIIGIISNGLPDVQYRKLETIGIRDYCSCIVLSEEIGIRKPDPRIFRHAASLLGIEPGHCLYVGNSYRADVFGAKAAGMAAGWLRRGAALPENADVLPDFSIDELHELPSLLNDR